MALCLAGAAIALGYALQLSNGFYSPTALLCVTIALLLTVWGTVGPQVPWFSRLGAAGTIFVVGLGLAFQLANLLIAPPGIYIRRFALVDFAPFLAGVLVCLVLAATWLWPVPWSKLRLPLLVLVFWGMGAWLIHVSPDPHIDVFVFQRESVKALFAGQNPYGMTYPNIYGDSKFYGPGLSTDEHLNFGFPYPPLSLWLSVPGQILGGDPRYAQLIAIGLSALLMGYAYPSASAEAVAALFLLTPRVFFVLEQSWTEPFLVLMLTLTVFVACRFPRWTPVALGLLVVVKQTMLFMLPLAFLLLPRGQVTWKNTLRLWIPAAAAGAAVSLPLALWDWPAFWHDVVSLQTIQPFRPDALSYLAWVYKISAVQLPVALAFLAALLGVVAGLQRLPHTPAGFAGGVALVYILFIAFNKQAFCNYYYFVIGAMCCASAAAAGWATAKDQIHA